MEEYAYLWNGQEWLVNDHGELTQKNKFPVFDLLESVVEREVAAMEAAYRSSRDKLICFFGKKKVDKSFNDAIMYITIKQ